MRIEADTSAIRRTHWTEYAVRFLFGGVITVATGLIAKRFGPGVAGLFLAFPAILPAGATLIEKHEQKKKQGAGFYGVARGRSIASIDAAGAAMGSLGLVGFAIVVWRVLPRHSAWLSLTVASLIWLTIAVAIWWFRKRMPEMRRFLRRPGTRS